MCNLKLTHRARTTYRILSKYPPPYCVRNRPVMPRSPHRRNSHHSGAAHKPLPTQSPEYIRYRAVRGVYHPVIINIT